jgi:hypothetical protein
VKHLPHHSPFIFSCSRRGAHDSIGRRHQQLAGAERIHIFRNHLPPFGRDFNETEDRARTLQRYGIATAGIGDDITDGQRQLEVVDGYGVKRCKVYADVEAPAQEVMIG